jgi:hypothetical protein
MRELPSCVRREAFGVAGFGVGAKQHRAIAVRSMKIDVASAHFWLEAELDEGERIDRMDAGRDAWAHRRCRLVFLRPMTFETIGLERRLPSLRATAGTCGDEKNEHERLARHASL